MPHREPSIGGPEIAHYTGAAGPYDWPGTCRVGYMPPRNRLLLLMESVNASASSENAPANPAEIQEKLVHYPEC